MVLQTLAGLGSMHGYAIAARLEQVSHGSLRLNMGTLYPGLMRLEQQRSMRGTWGVTDTNRKARFYAITAAGRRQQRLRANRVGAHGGDHAHGPGRVHLSEAHDDAPARLVQPPAEHRSSLAIRSRPGTGAPLSSRARSGRCGPPHADAIGTSYSSGSLALGRHLTGNGWSARSARRAVAHRPVHKHQTRRQRTGQAPRLHPDISALACARTGRQRRRLQPHAGTAPSTAALSRR